MFLSSYENKLDKKGRVSVPATFRSHLSSLGYNGFISYPSFNHAALEACSQDRIEKLLNHANIKNDILFVGLGKTFQIWEPKNFEKFKIQARKKSYQNRSSLKWENKQKEEIV